MALPPNVKAGQYRPVIFDVLDDIECNDSIKALVPKALRDITQFDVYLGKVIGRLSGGGDKTGLDVQPDHGRPGLPHKPGESAGAAADLENASSKMHRELRKDPLVDAGCCGQFV